MFSRRTFFTHAAAATIAMTTLARSSQEAQGAADHGDAHGAAEPPKPEAKSANLRTAPAGSPQAASPRSDDACQVFTPELQKATTSLAALKLLKEGNARFIAGKPLNCNALQAVEVTSHGQAPFAAVVGCIDSRVPPEQVFDQQLGDIFCARVAGNFVNDDIIGSLEYATKVAGAKAIVVLGHSSCGAIKGAIDGAKLGLLTKMLENFRPAIEMCSYVEGERSSANKQLVQTVAEANVVLATMKLTEKSNVLKELVVQRQLIIAPAMHDVYTGQVSWLS